jgi:hypothetical protein
MLDVEYPRDCLHSTELSVIAFSFQLLGSRVSYQLESNAGTQDPTRPIYWQTRLEGQDPQRYTEVLETLSDPKKLQSPYRSFSIKIPAGVTSVELIFTWSQVRVTLQTYK